MKLAVLVLGRKDIEHLQYPSPLKVPLASGKPQKGSGLCEDAGESLRGLSCLTHVSLACKVSGL